MGLELLLIIAFGGALLTYFLGKISSKLRNFFAVFISLTLIAIISCLYGRPLQKSYFHFLNLPLILRLDPFSWFFAIATQTITTLSVIFSLSYMKGKERLNFYYFSVLLVNGECLVLS